MKTKVLKFFMSNLGFSLLLMSKLLHIENKSTETHFVMKLLSIHLKTCQ